MIDLHCHILPDFPIDIAHSLGDVKHEEAVEAALKAAQMASQQGISQIVATPHIYPWHRAEVELIGESVAGLNAKLQARGIMTRIVHGAEVSFSEDLPQDLDRLQKLAINGKNYLMIEPLLTPELTFYLPPEADRVLLELLQAGFRPILVHPERVPELQADFSRLERLVAAGVLTQITAAFLIGWSDKKLLRTVERLLQAGLAHFVASDAHYGARWQVAMLPAWQKLAQNMGSEVAARLMHENQLAVIEGRPLS